MGAASTGPGAEEEGELEEAEDPGISETTEVGVKQIQILTDFGADSNGYYSVSSPQWTPYTNTVLINMAEQLATTYGSLDNAYVFARLVEYGSYDYDLAAYDSHFVINIGDLAAYQTALETAEAEAEEAAEEAEIADYIETAKSEYQNMWLYVQDKAIEWNDSGTNEHKEEIQDSVYTKVFSGSDCFMNLIHKALVSAGEISSSTDGSYKNATKYMHDNKDFDTTDWYFVVDDKKVGFYSSSDAEMYASSTGIYPLHASEYDGASKGVRGTVCVLGEIILDHFDKILVRWNDYKEDGKDKIKNHFNVCDL